MSGRLAHSGRSHGVIVGCPRADGRWLFIRRGPRAAAARGRVCLPGGMVEAGEAQRDAAVREMAEELGTAVEPVRCVWRFDFPDRPLSLWGWLGRLLGEPVVADPGEVAEILWLREDEAAAHPDGVANNPRVMAALSKAVTDR